MKWLDEMIDRVNAADDAVEWATSSRLEARRAVRNLEDAARVDDTVVDLVGCLIDEVVRLRAVINAKLHRRKCHDCGHVGWYADSRTPYCLCDQCRSQDTRRVKEAK